MLNGLDLFSGIGGISVGLKKWVRTVAYCERDRYAQSLLLSRMASNDIDRAPIWDDITSLKGSMLPKIDIIFGGFPCQDISIAGAGAGLAGKRSGLFSEIIRLSCELRPRFIFLENVPAISVRGLDRITMDLTKIGYDCRWTIVSAEELGAPHRRERWFCLAHATGISSVIEKTRLSCKNEMPRICSTTIGSSRGIRANWWSIEPHVGRVVNGLPRRVDRLRCLGNSVVPEQAKEAFIRLIGNRIAEEK